jgi:hypothetical protein
LDKWPAGAAGNGAGYPSAGPHFHEPILTVLATELSNDIKGDGTQGNYDERTDPGTDPATIEDDKEQEIADYRGSRQQDILGLDAFKGDGACDGLMDGIDTCCHIFLF